MKKLTALALVLSASVSLSANAGIVTNDTELLSAAGHQQFSQWLGQDVDLTRIFAKQDGDTSQEWYDAAGNQGPTLSLVEIFNDSERIVVGGYTAANWGEPGYHYSNNPNKHFLMNLSRGNIYRKQADNNWAIYFNPGYILAFGGGHDFYVNNTLSGGVSNIGHSYGDSSRYGDANYREEFTGSYGDWTVGKLETFTLSNSTGDFGTGATASIDEQGNIVTNTTADVSTPWSLAALGLAGLFGFRRYKLQTGETQ